MTGLRVGQRVVVVGMGELRSRVPKVGNRWSDWVARRRGSGPILAQSGWRTAFTILPETEQWLDVVLVDGTSFHGMLGSASTQIEETADRDLVLATPIKVRAQGAGEWTALQAGTVVVSAARISYFSVQYVSKATPAPSQASPAPVEAPPCGVTSSQSP